METKIGNEVLATIPVVVADERPSAEELKLINMVKELEEENEMPELKEVKAMSDLADLKEMPELKNVRVVPELAEVKVDPELEKVQQVPELSEEQEAPEVDEEGEFTLRQVVKWLYPWYKKTDGVERVGDWEQTLPVVMMTNLLLMWLAPRHHDTVSRVLHLYHPVDRSAMVYALMVYLLTGQRMQFRKAVAKQHYDLIIGMFENDMRGLVICDHLKAMLKKYGRKRR